MSHTISIYRQLLREIKPQKGAFVDQLRNVYRDNLNVNDPKKIAALNRNAENVLLYLKSSRQHKYLRERYAALVLEQKKRVEMSAKRVGLQLPKEYVPGDGAKEEAAATQRVLGAFSKTE